MGRKRFEVRSSVDGNVAFTADSVDREAAIWRFTARKAADRIARENADTVMGETMTVHEVPANG